MRRAATMTLLLTAAWTASAVGQDALFDGVFLLGARGGLAWSLPVSEGVLLLPSGGASFLGGFGPGGGGAELGGNVGVGAVAGGDSTGGLRVGMTWHRFAGLGGTVWLLEVGFVTRRKER